MKVYFACFVLLVAFSSAKATGENSRTVIPSSSLTKSSFVIATSSPIHSIITSSSVKPTPGNTSAINPSVTTSPNISSIIPSNTTASPNMSSTAHPNATSHVPSNGTTTVVTPSSSPSMHPTTGPTSRPTSHGKDDEDYDSMKKRMWIAGAFAILFAITTVILACLVYRQRKINRDLEGDPATSRLL